MSNNKINNWGEISKVSQLPEIKSVLFIGNPIYGPNPATKEENAAAAIMVIKRIPQLESCDCKTVTPQ